MAASSESDRRRAVAQTLASWRIEGFEPDEKHRALLDRYIAGELSLADLRARTDEAFGLRVKSAA